MQSIAKNRYVIERVFDEFIRSDDHYTVLLEYLRTIELHPGCPYESDRWYLGNFPRVWDKCHIVFDIDGSIRFYCYCSERHI
jgi:hypothetical protein